MKTARAVSAMSETRILKTLESRKYRALNLPEATLLDIAEKELARGVPEKDLEKAVREKLHQLIAPYLGDPDYTVEEAKLDEIPSEDIDALKKWCLKILDTHASTRERIPNLAAFYKFIFAQVGNMETILDVACGLNPFSLPWMPGGADLKYYAYDLHQPRLALISRFFGKFNRAGRAIQQDISINPPEIQADAAFFFKEAHRFESREKGSSRRLFERLNVPWIIVTLPAYNLTAQHPMRDRQRALIEKTISGTGWKMEEKEIGGEMIFFIRKNG